VREFFISGLAEGSNHIFTGWNGLSKKEFWSRVSKETRNHLRLLAISMTVLVSPGVGDKEEENNPAKNEQYENPRPIFPQLRKGVQQPRHHAEAYITAAECASRGLVTGCD